MKILVDFSKFNESVTFYADVPAQHSNKSLHDLAWDLKILVYDTVMNKLNQFEQERFKREKIMDQVVPDGFDFQNTEGTINFYLKGIPEHLIDDCVTAIKLRLDEQNVQYGEFTQEPSNSIDSDVIRIPIGHMDTPDNIPPQVNFSSMNFRKVMEELLGYTDVDYSGELSVGDLAMRLDQAKRKLSKFPSSTSVNVMRNVDKKGGMYGSKDLGQDYYSDAIEKLDSLIKWAHANNVTTVQYN